MKHVSTNRLENRLQEADCVLSYNRVHLLQCIDALISSRPCVLLRDLSRELGVGRQRIEKAIRASTGISFRDYRKRRCLEKALHLLLTDGYLPEKQIATRLGYGSTAAFCRFIKSSTGKTPSQLRATAWPTTQDYAT
jgi:AraC-like DNA-binding protein